jgi:hypothetical protein
VRHPERFTILKATKQRSSLAARENGGVLISPCNQASGFGGCSAVLMVGFYAEFGMIATATRPASLTSDDPRTPLDRPR